MKTFIFTKINKTDYLKLMKKLKKNHPELCLDRICSYYEKGRFFLLYDEQSSLTKEDVDLIAKYAKSSMPCSKYQKYTAKTPVCTGVLLTENNMTREISNLYFADGKIEMFHTDLCDTDEFSKRKDLFIMSQELSNRVMIKKELAEVYFNNLYSEPTLTEKKILSEVLDQIEVCEDLGCGLTNTQIKSWLQCANVRQVQIKAHTLKFAS